MSVSSLHADKFYEEVSQTKRLWTIKDDAGFPAPKNGEGKRAQPFWSSLTRVEKIIDTIDAYKNFNPWEISWDEFARNWVPGLEKDEILVGVNWSGDRATGYDVMPSDIVANVEHCIKQSTNK